MAHVHVNDLFDIRQAAKRLPESQRDDYLREVKYRLRRNFGNFPSSDDVQQTICEVIDELLPPRPSRQRTTKEGMGGPKNI
jgi:hypothetical protein